MGSQAILYSMLAEHCGMINGSSLSLTLVVNRSHFRIALEIVWLIKQEGEHVNSHYSRGRWKGAIHWEAEQLYR